MKMKRFFKRLCFPHPLILFCLCVAATIGLIYSFTRLESDSIAAIALYALSFYALVILCLRMPCLIACARRARRENKYYLRYRSDVRLRLNASLWGSLIYNGCYALLQLGLGLRHHSVWFYAMAGYYALLCAIRLSLATHIRKFAPGEQKMDEWRRYRLCGVGLFLMNGALVIFALYFVFHIRAIHHHEITTIAMAAYSFSALAIAIVNVARYRRYESPVCSAAKAISLAAATVSMLSLENTMLNTFSTSDQAQLQQIFLALSSIAVTSLLLCMAFYMIIHASRELKKFKKTFNRSKQI